MKCLVTYSRVGSILHLLEHFQIQPTFSNIITACPIPACGRMMTWVRFANAQTSHCWRCPTHHGHKMSPRAGSFFENSRLPLRKILGVIWCWAKDLPNKQTIEMTGISERHVISWFKVNEFVNIFII